MGKDRRKRPFSATCTERRIVCVCELIMKGAMSAPLKAESVHECALGETDIRRQVNLSWHRAISPMLCLLEDLHALSIGTDILHKHVDRGLGRSCVIKAIQHSSVHAVQSHMHSHLMLKCPAQTQHKWRQRTHVCTFSSKDSPQTREHLSSRLGNSRGGMARPAPFGWDSAPTPEAWCMCICMCLHVDELV